MPTSETERNSAFNSDQPNIILLSSSDANVDTFTATLPLDFDCSNSSVDSVVESVVDSNNRDIGTPVLTDIAEETIYETSFYDEKSLSPSTKKLTKENIIIENDIKEENISDHNTSSDQITEDENSKSSLKLENEDDIAYFTKVLPSETSDTNSVILDLNDTEMISENNTNRNNVFDSASVTLKNNTAVTNIIQVNSSTNNKIAIKPVTFTNASKFVPISISPNSMKRPANISIGQPASNVVTKVVVSQGKIGQPIMITNSPQKPKSICVLSNVCSTQSPVKCITFAEAKQMGLIAPGKLQPIQPSVNKQSIKQKVVVGNLSSITTPTTVTIPTTISVPAVQGTKKLQSLKPTTPAKILPAPLVSKPIATNQSQKIIVRQDYVVQPGTLVSKPPGNTSQVIAISNLQPSSVLSNNISPKKQVQYIKLVNNIGSTNVPTVTTAKGAKITTVTQTSVSKIDKDTPIIVASSPLVASNLNLKQTSKPPPGSVTVLPVVSPSLKSAPGQRLILPAVLKNKDSLINTDVKSQPLKQTGNIVVLPEEVLEKLKGELLATSGKIKEDVIQETVNDSVLQDKESTAEIRSRSPNKYVNTFPLETNTAPPPTGNGLKSRKPCNCTRSQCLKLYCECFANGEFCNNCNCVSCHNNISHEENRQHAIRSCLDRNPQAFRPKIGKCLVGLNDRRHTKGCHCKRSGCLKNYCECYEAQIPCSENCKCVGCKNIDDMLFNASTFGNNFEKNESCLEFQSFSKNKLTAEINDAVGQSSNSSNSRRVFSFFKDQVVEATCQCLFAQAEEVKRKNINLEDGQKQILEEFGRCLVQIIECTTNKSNKYSSS